MFGAVKAWMILGGGCRRRLPWRLSFIALCCKRRVSRCSRRWEILQLWIHTQKLFLLCLSVDNFFSTHEMIIMTCFYVYKNSLRDRTFKICFMKCQSYIKLPHGVLFISNDWFRRKKKKKKLGKKKYPRPKPTVLYAGP